MKSPLINYQEYKRVYQPKVLGQKTKIVGWPRCYRREVGLKKNLWQAIKAMLF